MSESIREIIESAWENRELLSSAETKSAIESVVSNLDQGYLRVAEPTASGWIVNEWIKKAVILYFPIRQMEVTEAGPLEFHDKIPLKHHYNKLGVRVVPSAIAPYGA